MELLGCPHCDRIFFNRRLMRNHIEAAHNDGNRDEAEPEPQRAEVAVQVDEPRIEEDDEDAFQVIIHLPQENGQQEEGEEEEEEEGNQQQEQEEEEGNQQEENPDLNDMILGAEVDHDWIEAFVIPDNAAALPNEALPYGVVDPRLNENLPDYHNRPDEERPQQRPPTPVQLDEPLVNGHVDVGELGTMLRYFTCPYCRASFRNVDIERHVRLVHRRYGGRRCNFLIGPGRRCNMYCFNLELFLVHRNLHH